MSEAEKPANEIDALTARINAKYREVEYLARSTVEAGIELGGMLAEKKEALGHGAWLPWLRENFEGSERHAQRFMKLYAERDKLLSGDPTRVSDLSLREAFKEIAAPNKELPAPREEAKDVTFENVAALMKSLRAIRDRELFRAGGHDTFIAYLKEEFPEQQPEKCEIALKGWELVIDNPPPELRGAPPEKARELVDRLVALTRPPEPGSGLVIVGRRLQEVEERELYKLIGYPTFARFCRECLGLTRRSQALLSTAVELADIDLFFDMDNFDLEMPIPDNFMELDWDRALPLLDEFVELTDAEVGGDHD
jgi:hypothetical protein